MYEIIGMDGYKVEIRSQSGQILYKSPNDLKIVEAQLTNESVDKIQIYEVEKF